MQQFLCPPRRPFAHIPLSFPILSTGISGARKKPSRNNRDLCIHYQPVLRCDSFALFSIAAAQYSLPKRRSLFPVRDVFRHRTLLHDAISRDRWSITMTKCGTITTFILRCLPFSQNPARTPLGKRNFGISLKSREFDCRD